MIVARIGIQETAHLLCKILLVTGALLFMKMRIHGAFMLGESVHRKDCAYQGQPVSVDLAPAILYDSKFALSDVKDR
jgi:hypothetical protein